MKRIICIAACLFACVQVANASGNVKTEDLHLTAKHITSAFAVKGFSVPKLYLFRNGALVYETPTGVGSVPKQFVDCLESSVKCGAAGTVPPADAKAVATVLEMKSVRAARQGLSLVSFEFGESLPYCPGCSAFYPVVEQDLAASKQSVTWYRVKFEKNSYADGVK